MRNASSRRKLAPDILAEEIEKYDIDLALLNNNKRNFSLVQDTNRLKLDYVGFEHSLFRRDNPNFPVLGKLLARPACWSDDDRPGLAGGARESHPDPA